MRRRKPARNRRRFVLAALLLALAAVAVFLWLRPRDAVFEIAETDGKRIDVEGDRAAHWSGENISLRKQNGETIWTVPAQASTLQIALRNGRVLVAEKEGLTVWTAKGERQTHTPWPTDPVIVRFGERSVMAVYPQMVLVFDTNGLRTGTFSFSNTVLDVRETQGGWIALTYEWTPEQSRGAAYYLQGETEANLVAAAAGDLILSAVRVGEATAFATSQGVFLQADSGDMQPLPLTAFAGMEGGSSLRVADGKTLRQFSADGTEGKPQTVSGTYRHVAFGDGWTAYWQEDALAVIRSGGVVERAEKGLLDVRAEGETIVLFYVDRIERIAIGSFR